jgi:CDP-paratose 2-epimerase
VSLRELLAHIGDLTGHAPDIRYSDWRAGDQRYFVADSAAARGALDLPAYTGWRDGIARLADWLRDDRGLPPPARERQAELVGDRA